jgi:hypothetical protein
VAWPQEREGGWREAGARRSLSGRVWVWWWEEGLGEVVARSWIGDSMKVYAPVTAKFAGDART